MNKKTIQQLEERRRKLLNKLVSVANELREIDTTIKKIRTGKLRQPPPPPVKGKINPHNPGITADTFGDLIPSFGPSR